MSKRYLHFLVKVVGKVRLKRGQIKAGLLSYPNSSSTGTLKEELREDVSKIGSFFFSSRCWLHYQCELTKLHFTKPVLIYCWWQLPFHHRLPRGLREASVAESLRVTCRGAELKAQYPPQMVHNCLECSFRGSGFSGLCGHLPSMYKCTNYSLKKLILLSSPYLCPITPLFFFFVRTWVCVSMTVVLLSIKWRINIKLWVRSKSNIILFISKDICYPLWLIYSHVNCAM